MAPPRFQVIISPPAGREPPADVGQFGATATTWRLLGSNHRELGRSAAPFDDVEQCLYAIRQLQAAMSRLESQVVAHPTIGSWFWRINVDNVAVAVASRLYQRRRESVQSLSRTLESIPLVDREPVILRPRGTPDRENRRVLTGPSRLTKIIDLRDSATNFAARSQPMTGNQA